MHASTVLLWLAPSLALARIHLDVHAAAARQLHFDTPDQHRMPVATQPRTALALGRGAARPAAAAAAANPSVVVHVVDPASPSTSFVTAPHVQASQAAARDPASQPPSAEFDDEDEEEEAGSDSPNFGRACDYSNGGAFQSCGDYFDEAAGLDHGLFCSPANICAGKNAVCGASEACNQGEQALSRQPRSPRIRLLTRAFDRPDLRPRSPPLRRTDRQAPRHRNRPPGLSPRVRRRKVSPRCRSVPDRPRRLRVRACRDGRPGVRRVPVPRREGLLPDRARARDELSPGRLRSP